MKARHVLLISDSCYSGTLFGQARAMPQVIDDKYYLNLYNEKSRWGMTSGNKTPVSDRGTGNHSVFAYQLLKELRKSEKPYISTQEIYTRIAPIVSNNSEQTPLCRPIRNTGDQGGEFIFVASSGRAVSMKKSISVKAEPAQLPPEVGVSFDDILKAEEVQRQAKEKWRDWQQAREKEYRSIKEIDESKNLTPEQKIVAWQRFLAAVSQDNPYSRQDDEIRSYSHSRLNHWQSVKSPNTKPWVDAYTSAMEALDKDDFNTARERFRKFIKTYPKSDRADNAQYHIAQTYYREMWYEKAILEHQKVIEKYPKGNRVMKSLFAQGMAFLNLKDKSNARLIFSELIIKYPKSQEAKAAKRKLKEIDP